MNTIHSNEGEEIDLSVPIWINPVDFSWDSINTIQNGKRDVDRLISENPDALDNEIQKETHKFFAMQMSTLCACIDALANTDGNPLMEISVDRLLTGKMANSTLEHPELKPWNIIELSFAQENKETRIFNEYTLTGFVENADFLDGNVALFGAQIEKHQTFEGKRSKSLITRGYVLLALPIVAKWRENGGDKVRQGVRPLLYSTQNYSNVESLNKNIFRDKPEEFITWKRALAELGKVGEKGLTSIKIIRPIDSDILDGPKIGSQESSKNLVDRAKNFARAIQDILK